MDEKFDLQDVIERAKEMFSGDEGKAQLQGIMDMLKSNHEMTDKARLLMSLKPFLGDARRKKVDEAVRLMGMTEVLAVFKEK